MVKILEAGCLLTVLAIAAPAVAQNEATPGPDVPGETGEAVDETIEDAADAEEKKPEGETFPITGSLSMSYSFGQSNFAPAPDSTLADQFPTVDPAPKQEGSQFLGLDLALSYSVIESVSLSASVGVLKTIAFGPLGGSDGSSLVKYETNLTDASLGARWSAYTVPVADIKLSVNGGLRLPTSKGSITQGLIVGTRVGVGASRKIGPVNISLSGGFSYNAWENPTQQIEVRFADLIAVSGADLGRPLPLTGWSTGLSVTYSIIEDLSVSASYQLSNRLSGYEGPDDEFTSEFAQTGTQYGTGAHAFTASANYTLPFETGTSVGLTMSTAQGLYSADNKRVTNPFFDTESAQGAYTGYVLSLSQSL